MEINLRVLMSAPCDFDLQFKFVMDEVMPFFSDSIRLIGF